MVGWDAGPGTGSRKYRSPNPSNPTAPTIAVDCVGVETTGEGPRRPPPTATRAHPPCPAGGWRPPVRLLRKQVTIDAPAAIVYRHLTTAEGLLRWMAVAASVDPVPDGRVEWTHEDGSTMLGRFVELVPVRRVVFRYGWKDDLLGLPPASTVVEIDLEEAAGRTTLTLVHRGIPVASVEEHDRGWTYFLDRLSASLPDELEHAPDADTPGRS